MTETTPKRLPVTVDKPIPLTFDLGNLTAFDTNPIPQTSPSDIEQVLYNTSRDAAQLLINQILTTAQLKSTQDGVYAELPDPITPIPREKPLPKPKEPTKWELFAKKKGIAAKQKDGKLIFDEATKEWVPKWGYKGANKTVENDWLVEVDDKKDPNAEHNPRTLNRAERMEKIKKNERQQKKNERKNADAGGSGKHGISFVGKGVKKRKY